MTEFPAIDVQKALALITFVVCETTISLLNVRLPNVGTFIKPLFSLFSENIFD